MTFGSDEKKLREQMRRDRRAQRALPSGFRILKGAEVNIRKDGTLDIDDETLAELDVVGIAVHSHFNLPRVEMTARIDPRHAQSARRHPLPPDRPEHRQARAVDLDLDAVIAAALETGTVLEVDAYPDRFDLKDEHVRR